MTSCENKFEEDTNSIEHFTLDSSISDVTNNISFKGFGDLIFPIDLEYDKNTPLKKAGNIYLWYNCINPNKTVEIVNYMKREVESGKQIFYNIYTDEEIKENPEKKNVGIFYFRGKENNQFAIINAGGAFKYVGAMQDSFPHALELAKKGYNAFALIYRPSVQAAMEDLAHAIAFIHENAKELQVDPSNYSVWGGSAGGRMSAWLGNHGTESFGEKEYPRPSAVIMQYTNFSEVTGTEPPTYNCIGTSDTIANYQTMQRRISNIKANGIDAEIEVFEGLPHGFGLGEGTNAEGWINNAIKFWNMNMQNKK